MTGHTIDIESEQLLDNSGAASFIGRLQGKDRPVHKNQIRRWQRRGVSGLRLPSVMIGARRFTSIEAITWWVAAMTAAAEPERNAPRSLASAPLTKSEQQALTAAGIA